MNPLIPQPSLPQFSLSELRRWLAAFLLTGLLARAVLFAIATPMAGDQAALGINLLQRNYAGLTRPLDHDQVAPIGFLWIEKFVMQTCGASEYSVRLVPTLAAVAALFVFYLWAKWLIPPAAAVLAAGVLCVSSFTIRHAVELKPYGIDLFAAALLLYLATRFIRENRPVFLGWMAALIPILVVTSYPTIFIGAAVALALLWRWKKMNPRARILIVAYGLLLAAAFLIIVYPIARAQYLGTHDKMAAYWVSGFPPRGVGPFLLWLAAVHTGSLFDYPIEGDTPWCAVGLVLCIIGVWSWLRGRHWRFAGILFLPFALTFLAALTRRYPYGNARISQHLAPAIILMTGAGLWALIQRFGRFTLRAWRTVAFILIVAGIAQPAVELSNAMRGWPGHGLDADAREFAREVWQLGPETRVLVSSSQVQTPDSLQWYLVKSGVPVQYGPPASYPPGPYWIVGPQSANPAAHWVLTLHNYNGDGRPWQAIGFLPEPPHPAAGRN